MINHPQANSLRQTDRSATSYVNTFNYNRSLPAWSSSRVHPRIIKWQTVCPRQNNAPLREKKNHLRYIDDDVEESKRFPVTRLICIDSFIRCFAAHLWEWGGISWPVDPDVGDTIWLTGHHVDQWSLSRGHPLGHSSVCMSVVLSLYPACVRVDSSCSQIDKHFAR